MLRTVELTGDVLEGVQQAVAGTQGIRIDETVDELVDETPTAGVELRPVPPAEDADARCWRGAVVAAASG